MNKPFNRYNVSKVFLDSYFKKIDYFFKMFKDDLERYFIVSINDQPNIYWTILRTEYEKYIDEQNYNQSLIDQQFDNQKEKLNELL